MCYDDSKNNEGRAAAGTIQTTNVTEKDAQWSGVRGLVPGAYPEGTKGSIPPFACFDSRCQAHAAPGRPPRVSPL